MKLICPLCGAVHSAEAWENDATARQCLAIVAELPEAISRRALAYIALFRPMSGRGLIWSKALRLLNELKQLAADPYIQWDGKPARPGSSTTWGQALDQIIARPPRRLPLTSHGYLRSIAYDLADAMDRAEEVRRNQEERSGSALVPKNDQGEQPQWQPGASEFARVRAAIRGVGKDMK